jgi:type IV pilus assembly protein PilA
VSPSQSFPSRSFATRAKRTAGQADGFSLPEVLVAMLIIGVLAAIAIPLFLSTTNKATDVQAKELVRNAQTATESFAADHSGGYANLSPKEVAAEEPTIATAASTQHAFLSAASGNEREYTLTATATDGDELTIARSAQGAVTRSCHSPKLKTGCNGAENSSW